MFLILFVTISFLLSGNLYSQMFFSPVSNSIESTQTSEHKPQSKVWYYGGYWWAVIPVDADGGDPAGTYLWRLTGTTLTKLIKLSDYNQTWADVKENGGVTHILLQRSGSTTVELVSIEFVAGSPPTYKPWTLRPSNKSITLDAQLEVATIDIDSNGRLWLASDGFTSINVRWSDSPYSSYWSSPIILNSGHATSNDDICAITAFDGNKIGILWSNQSEGEFQFRYHLDSNTDPTDWEPLEVPVSNTGVADDHINFAVDNAGNIYAAVKTSYDDSRTNIGLLVRRTTAVDEDNWESLHTVTTGNAYASRPIALLNEAENLIIVLYQQPQNGGDVDYKYSDKDLISFSSELTMDNDYQDITSTKQSFTDEVLILYNLDGSPTSYEYWYGTKADFYPFPVELSLFSAELITNNILIKWRTETETNNYGFYIERMIDQSGWESVGFVAGNGNSNSPKDYSYIDENIAASSLYKYRLKQIDNDGSFEYSSEVAVNTGIIENYYLSQNYPNPFNPSTKIEFSIPERQQAILRVYNTLGEVVGELVNDVRERGNYSVTFDASKLPSGTYYYTLSAGDYSSAKKMSLLK